MVTGSHNPPAHNGFKMMLGKAAFFGAAIQELGEIAAVLTGDPEEDTVIRYVRKAGLHAQQLHQELVAFSPADPRVAAG